MKPVDTILWAVREIVPIVEGYGEIEAVPNLLHRIAAVVAPEETVVVRRPIRVSRPKIVNPGELEKYVDLATDSVSTGGAILVLLDADDDCPAQLGPHLLERATAAAPNHAVSVVLAKSEYEAWFLASATTVAGHIGIRSDFTPPAEPEAVRDAKGYLTARMPRGQSYSPNKHQQKLTRALDPDLARSAPSFDKLWREVASLLTGGAAPAGH